MMMPIAKDPQSQPQDNPGGPDVSPTPPAVDPFKRFFLYYIDYVNKTKKWLTKGTPHDGQ